MEVMRAAEERAAEIASAGDGAGPGDVLRLELGQPCSGAPSGARKAAVAAIGSDVLGYTSALGIDPLRERLARHYLDTYGIDLDPGRVMLTAGASGAFTLAFLSCFDPGDRVVVTAPGYPCYRNVLATLGVDVVELPVGPETRFQPTPEMLEEIAAGGPVAGIVVASPSNPTGTMLAADELAALVAWCERAGAWLVSDEIYHGITYESPAHSALEFGGGARTGDAAGVVVVNSFSKYFSMTGWRLGWLVLPPQLIRPAERLAQNLTIATSTLAQHAALGAFDSLDECEQNVARYGRNREVLLRGLEPLAEFGLGPTAPADGAFYVYLNVSGVCDDSLALARTWLDELNVAVTPGHDFDTIAGRSWVRLSFAGAEDEIAEAVSRIDGWARRR
ncbi:MAG TPA: 1-aminocyclopropane-1-carboxylate deaminase [Acidimicrobiaceae bacterium]|nr:1-aminocyclopropane-1-carboxylate deaminase [Acidimicrobiaceae bacterium]